MDGRRFDALTRQLARTTSRRRAVGALALAAAGAIRVGRAPTATAQSPRCRASQVGERCGECGVCLRTSEFGSVRCVPFAHGCRGGASDDACPSCDPDTVTCRPAQKCGPCEKCITGFAQGCTYVYEGRNHQCNPETNPCDPATGKCRCRQGLTWCDPDCADLKTDPNHCGQCHYTCRTCENCREGKCVPCDEECERCDEQRGCVSTCEDQCKVCLDGQCVKPDPPICVCEADGEGGPPTAKRIYLPVVAAAGAAAAVEPCGEGDRAQCCVPEECCGEGDKQQCCAAGNCCGEGGRAECCAAGYACLEASEGGPICCMPELVCGDVCCAGGEECVSPGCCCWGPDMTPQGACIQCRSGRVR